MLTAHDIPYPDDDPDELNRLRERAAKDAYFAMLEAIMLGDEVTGAELNHVLEASGKSYRDVYVDLAPWFAQHPE